MSFLKRKEFQLYQAGNEEGQNTMEYTWDINSVNDSVTNVSVGIKELNSIYNRTAPFFLALVLKRQIKKITDFRDGLNKHIKSFKVQIDGEATSEVTFRPINLKAYCRKSANYDKERCRHYWILTAK
jgi:hypothetical protein